MIPVRRCIKRLETTLISCSRQSLPRPARLYSTPSKARNAPALAAQAAHASVDHSAFVSQIKDARRDSDSPRDDMHGFLKRRMPYTILPPPLPEDQTSNLNDFYFTDSPTQDSLAIIDACLHDLYDVPRAKHVFELLRKSSKADAMLDFRLYNSILGAFVSMATHKDTENRVLWLEDAWTLFDAMESGKEVAQPNANTYAIMLIAWLRFNPGSANPVTEVEISDPSAILRGIVDREVPVAKVVASRSVSSDQEAADMIKILSKTAVDMNILSVMEELGQTQALGGNLLPDPLQDVPEVMPVWRVKERDSVDGSATSEREVPFNLETLRKHLGQLALARRVLPDDVPARQKLLEDSVYEVATERLKRQAEIFEELGIGDNRLNSSHLQRWMWDWHQKLQKRLKSEIADIIEAEEAISESKANARLGPFLSLVSTEKLSLITILELMRLQGTGGVSGGMKTARALLTIGKAVELEHKAEMCRRNNIQIPNHSYRPGEHDFFTKMGYRDLHARRITARKYMEDAEEWASAWTQVLRVKIGSLLVDALMDVATVVRSVYVKKSGETFSEEQPAFFHSYEYLRGHKLGVIRLNPKVAEHMARDGLRETLHPRQLPMLIKPKPWLSHDQGGYLYSQSSVMRFKDSMEQQSYLRHASALGNLELVYAGLDVLGSTPWKINRNVFDVVLKVWNSGERVVKIPPATYEVPEPEKPENYDTDPKAKLIYLMRQKTWSEIKANNHSDRCSVNYKIEIARAFLGDTFYMPHNVDFRGRAYPIPPHFNHIGDDLSRGLLLFAEARPLGERGLRWLKVHMANLYGYDKGSFDERIQFVEDHLADIYDSAENPLEGKRWWQTADDPWQCLGACMELRAALESPDPSAYESSFPVHQDGTCNGLQHYAALGGDAQGAQQVNLGVADRPSDVYTYVANMVQNKIEEDSKKDVKYAKIVNGKITRKVVKQTVMTTVYGVTFVGAREQIEKQLKDRRDIPDEECWGASSYVAKKVIECIGNLFTGAQDIQNWLNICARLISKSIPPERLPAAMQAPKKSRAKRPVGATRLKQEQMTAVVWTTPLGLPIVQPYRKTKKKQVHTSIQTVFISDPNAPAVVNSAKQASAFPPNFIHSLDATHMMLTALECRTQGLTFASVHDSYWTHACSIDQMSTIIRDTFVALHSSDVLGKIHAEFMERYKGYKVPITSVKGGTLLEKLSSMEKKLSLADMVDSADTSEDVPTINAEEASSTSEDLLAALDKAIGLTESDESDDLPEADAVRTTSEVPEPAKATPTKRRRRTSDASEYLAVRREQDTESPDDVKMPNIFIELTKLFPPLPKKGNFEVNTIKKSLYFFS